MGCNGWLVGSLVGLLVGWLVYSCCSHLERRISVKRFVSFQFLNLTHSVGLLGRVISLPQGRYLTQTQNKHRQTSMPRVGFEPTIPAFQQRKTVHALDRAATVIGNGLQWDKRIVLYAWTGEAKCLIWQSNRLRDHGIAQVVSRRLLTVVARV
jgi:hypothetical protein